MNNGVFVFSLMMTLLVPISSLALWENPTLSTTIFVGMIVYAIPSFVAAGREHHNATAICALNFLLGWSFIGWAISLVWALTATNTYNSGALNETETNNV